MTDKPLSPEEVAQRMSPADRPDAVSVDFVKRRMSSRRWPSVKLGHCRYMTEAQFQRALDIESQDEFQRPGPSAAGVSPRSRRRRSA